MNVWQFDDDDAPPAATEPAKSGAKRVFFADDDPTAAPAGRSATTSAASRRKQISASELVIDDDQDDGEGRGSSKAHTSVPSGRKLNETAAPDVVKRVGFSEGSSEPAVVIPARSAADADDMDAYAHHLVRTYLLHQGHDDVAALLDLEKPCPPLDEVALKVMHRQIADVDDATDPLLEQFLRAQWLRQPSDAKPKRSSSKDSSKSRDKPSRRKKPSLNVITSVEDSATVAEPIPSSDGDFNRLNHPGSTPRAPSTGSDDEALRGSTVYGAPGSTPMARAKDLAAFGFDDVDDFPPPVGSAAPTGAGDWAGPSQYALAKRAAQKHGKHVHLGGPGTTPTKEYVFFRETPPSFVTETIEAAVEVYEKLGHDPAFHAQAAPVERMVELQSSEVGKYRVGQRVESLGAMRNVSGIITQVYGSRQCGSSGPGTIIIDTSPDDSDGSTAAAGSSG